MFCGAPKDMIVHFIYESILVCGFIFANVMFSVLDITTSWAYIFVQGGLDLIGKATDLKSVGILSLESSILSPSATKRHFHVSCVFAAYFIFPKD